MKSSTRPARAAFPLSAALHKNLNSYTLGATAAGVALLASTQPAEAEIVFTPANGQIIHGMKLSLDLNHDGITDFYLINSLHFSATRTADQFSVRPSLGNGIWASNRISYFAAALPAGVSIDSKAPFHSIQMGMAFASNADGGYFSGGGWTSARNRFLGLKFFIDGEVHFGWARLTVSADKYTQRVTGTLTGYAYETEPDKAIRTGDTGKSREGLSSSSQILVRPKQEARPDLTLAALALGADGLAIWRRR